MFPSDCGPKAASAATTESRIPLRQKCIFWAITLPQHGMTAVLPMLLVSRVSNLREDFLHSSKVVV